MTDTWTEEMRERYRVMMADGLRAAAERRAALPPEVEFEIARRLARLGPDMCNWFCGPSNDKGRQSSYIATPAEVAEWKRNKSLDIAD